MSIILLSVAAVVLVLIVIIIVLGYKKAPNDKIFIISGLRKKPKMITGKAAIMIPFLERCDVLLLNLIQIDIKTEKSIPTMEFINVNIDAVATIKINNNEEALSFARENFLNKNSQYIAAIAGQILEGTLREIIGRMELKELVHNREALANKVEETTRDELAKIGLTVENFKIQNFVDENGVIVDLGVDNIMKIKKAAQIAKANAEKDIAVAQSEANSMSNEAEVKANLEIAERDNGLIIKRAQLQATSDKEKAVADAAYAISEQEARRKVEIVTVDADIARTEKEAEQKEREIKVQENSLRAQIEKQADAEKYQKEINAEAEKVARQKRIDAETYEIERKAEARRREVELEAFEIEREAEARKKEAEGILAVGQAEAEVIMKKAEALNSYNQEALQQMLITQLPDIMRAVAEPLGKVDNITMYGNGNVSNMIQDTFSTTTGLVEGVKNSTGVDLGQFMTNMMSTKAALETTDLKTNAKKE